MSTEPLTTLGPTSAGLGCGDAAASSVSLAPISVHPDPEEAAP